MEKRPGSPKRSRTRKSKSSSARRLRARLRKLESFDRTFLDDPEGLLVGVDEAGRGALAGPVVASAVILPRGSGLVGVDDSKALSEEEREALFGRIVEAAVAVGISFMHPEAIDRHNILNASLMAMARAIENLRCEPTLVLLDGRDRLNVPWKTVAVVGGDRKSLSIAAASIVAKVSRDRVMRKLHKRYPEYNFFHNKGYGTKDHIDAIDAHGASEAHRLSYRPNAVEKNLSLF